MYYLEPVTKFQSKYCSNTRFCFCLNICLNYFFKLQKSSISEASMQIRLVAECSLKKISSRQVICLPGRSKCLTNPLFSMLCLFLEFPVPVLQHPVHELLSRPSSSPPFFHPISLSVESPLRMCPIQFFCLVLIISIKDLFKSTFFNTSSFVLCYVQLILSILLHIHISKASIRLTSYFLTVHVSVKRDAQYQCFNHSFPDVSI